MAFVLEAFFAEMELEESLEGEEEKVSSFVKFHSPACFWYFSGSCLYTLHPHTCFVQFVSGCQCKN